MRKVAIVLALYALQACGDVANEKGSAEDDLIGTWAYEDATSQCAVGATFARGDGGKLQMEWDVICVLDDGSVGMQADVGPATVTGQTISASSDYSTCHDADREPITAAFEFIGDTLRLSTSEQIFLLERVEDTEGGGGSAVLGCFEEDGLFTPGELQPT